MLYLKQEGRPVQTQEIKMNLISTISFTNKKIMSKIPEKCLVAGVYIETSNLKIEAAINLVVEGYLVIGFPLIVSNTKRKVWSKIPGTVRTFSNS